MTEVTVSNPSAAALIAALAKRQRAHAFTDIRRYRAMLRNSGTQLNEHDYIQAWKDLQAAGAGRIVYGRRGKPTKFAWNRNLKDVVKDLVQTKVAPHAEPMTVKDATSVIVVLGAGRLAELKLPSQFSQADADTITSILQTFVPK